jgi:hypothetical protein
MGFILIWMRGSISIGTEEFDDLEAAAAHGNDQLTQMQSRFGATAVKVIDEAGNPHFLKSISRG